MASITLNTTGPSPDPLSASSGEALTITNALGADVTLTLSHAGLINPSSGTTLLVSSAGFTGTIGTTSGSFDYDPPGDKRAMRTGTINVN